MTDRDAARDRAIDKVRAMLAKAASTTHDAEADAFTTKAFEIMARYDIDERDIGDATSTAITRRTLDLEGWGNATRGALFFMAKVYELRGGQVYAVWSDRGRAYAYGNEAAHEFATAVFDLMLPQLRAALARDKPRSRKYYAYGWAQRASARLASAQARVYSQSSAVVPTTDAAEAAARAEFTVMAKQREKASVNDLLDKALGAARGDMVDVGAARLR